LNDLELKLRKSIEGDPEYKNSAVLLASVTEVLELAQSELVQRGFEVRKLDNLADHTHSFPVLEILSPPQHEVDLISRNLRTMAAEANKPRFVYDPVSLVSRRVRGSWTASKQLLSLNLSSLFDKRTIPSTLVHERMHFEKSQAINARSQGPLKAFFGYFSAKTLSGQSAYAQKGFISIDEAKAWMTNIRSREQDLRKIMPRTGRAVAEKNRIRRDSLLALYDNYLKITNDLIRHLEAVEKKIDRRFFRGTQFEGKVWFMNESVLSAHVVTELDGVEFHYWVPLVSVGEKASADELHTALLAQVRQSLEALRNHQGLVERRAENAKTVLSDPAAPDFQERLQRFVESPLDGALP
jgi:predicted nucleic acid-binding Zn ribbon protein